MGSNKMNLCTREPAREVDCRTPYGAEIMYVLTYTFIRPYGAVHKQRHKSEFKLFYFYDILSSIRGL